MIKWGFFKIFLVIFAIKFSPTYFKRSANKSLMCELECNSNNEFAPIDLCDITILSVNFNDGVHMNVSFIHPGVWRYLALGDEFVDVVSFRDSDSFIFQREVDSVDVWLKAQDKIAHIMRGLVQFQLFLQFKQSLSLILKILYK